MRRKRRISLVFWFVFTKANTFGRVSTGRELLNNRSLLSLLSSGVVSQWSHANTSWVVEVLQWPAVWLTEGCGRTGFHLQNVRNPVAMKSAAAFIAHSGAVRQSGKLCEGQCGWRERKEKVNKCVCHSWGELIFVGALSGWFLRFRQSLCSKTSGHACVRACVSPVHTERMNTWCAQLSTCSDRKVLDDAFTLGQTESKQAVV